MSDDKQDKPETGTEPEDTRPEETGDQEGQGTAQEGETEVSEQDPAGDGQPPGQAAAAGRARTLAVTALVLVVLLALAFTVFGWMLWERQQQLASAQDGFVSAMELAELREGAVSRADRLAGRLDNLAAEHQSHVQQLARTEEAMASVRERQSRVDQGMDRLRELAAARGDEWVRSEVEYLYGVAGHRLNLHRDPAGALAALREADALLERIGSETVDERRQLRRAINALLDVRELDRAALSARLGELVGAVDDWQPRQPDTRLEPQPMERQPDADLGSVEGWRQAAGRAWDQFRASLASLVVVHRGEPAPPLISPEQGWFLRENLRLQLQTARLALLEGDADTWRDSLEQAEAWLGAHFEDDAAVRSARESLAELREVSLERELPTLDALPARQDPGGNGAGSGGEDGE